MATTQLHITLPDEAIRRIQEKIASGQYASPSDVLLEALTRFDDPVEDLEDIGPWLPAQAAALARHCEEYPEELLTLDQMRESVARELARLRCPE